jgi:flagellar hook-associated protein 2
MSTGAISGASTQPLLRVQGLGSGLKTEEIISALMAIERRPLARMSEETIVHEAQASSLRALQSTLQGLAASAGELASPMLFAAHQTVSSSEPSRVSATVSNGAASGGYELTVTALASAAQRVFSYMPPAAAQTITIDGHELHLAAHESLAEVANAINANSEMTVYAGAVGTETLVLSARQTGELGSNFIEVAGGAGALAEKAGSARRGTNAEYKIDGIEGSSASNTLTEAIPGATLTLSALTSAGPVSIDISPPGINTAGLAEQVKTFVSSYNSAITKLQSEISTKPRVGIQAEAETRTGLLFGDTELEGLTAALRQSIYTPVAGLPASMSSLASIGVNTGAPSAGPPSQASLEGKLTIEEAQLQEALKTNPEGVRKMLEGWAQGFQKTVEAYAGPGGSIETRIQGDQSQSAYVAGQITSLEESLAVRQRTLEAQYVALEVAMQRSSSQSAWLASQLAKLPSTTLSSASVTGG